MNPVNAAEPPLVRIDSLPDRPLAALAELVQHRELIYFLVWRDIKVRYQQTVLGLAWAAIQPIGTMVIFTVVFGRLAQLPSDGVPYPVFVMASLLPWQVFSSSLMGASNSLVGSSTLVSKVYFPRLIVPIAAVLATLADFAVSFALLLAMLAYYHIVPGWGVVLLPAFLALALIVALAVGLWSSALNVRYRDVRYVMPFVMQFWMFASPVAYSASLVKRPLARLVFGLNPMTGVIQGFRWALLGSPPPGPLLWASVGITAVVLAGGLLFFKRMEATFIDVI